MSNIYIGLVHYPVLNRHGEIITSGVTNLDIHDIARTAITFGIKKFIVIHPSDRQIEILNKILDFWKTDLATFFNEDRVLALKTIDFKKSIEETINFIQNQEGDIPLIITTTAKMQNNSLSFNVLKDMISKKNKPIILLFGTGSGLGEAVHNTADYVLMPINGVAGYNHLSVRSAVAIVLDRLFSEEYKEYNDG
jgi:hypothetical protein